MRVTLQNTQTLALFFLWKNVLDLQLMCVFSFIFPQALIAFPRQAQPVESKAKQAQHTVVGWGGKMPSNLAVFRGCPD